MSQTSDHTFSFLSPNSRWKIVYERHYPLTFCKPSHISQTPRGMNIDLHKQCQSLFERGIKNLFAQKFKLYFHPHLNVCEYCDDTKSTYYCITVRTALKHSCPGKEIIKQYASENTPQCTFFYPRQVTVSKLRSVSWELYRHLLSSHSLCLTWKLTESSIGPLRTAKDNLEPRARGKRSKGLWDSIVTIQCGPI